MRTVSAAQPCSITLLDEKERKFLLTKRGLKKLCEEFGIETFNEITGKPPLDILSAMLILAQYGEDKDLNSDILDDLIPMDTEWALRAIQAILGVSTPDADPTPASPALSAATP